MNFKAFIVGLFLSGILILPHSTYAQSPKDNLVEEMREYVGMLEYDGKSFFIGQISRFGNNKIKLNAQEEFSDPRQLILDLSRIKPSSLKLARSSSPTNGSFEHFEIKFEGQGSIYEPGSDEGNKMYNSVNLCLAGKDLFEATTFDEQIAENILKLLKASSLASKSVNREGVRKTYSIKNEDALIREIQQAKGVQFEANNVQGRYVIIHGGMKEFFGKVKSMCINIETEKSLEEIHPDVSVDLIYILVRTYLGKRETVAEISSVFPNRNLPPKCCKDCFSFPESDTFPSGAYEVFIYLGDEQVRKLGNFVFAVK